MTGSSSPRLYPWAAAMLAELESVPLVRHGGYGVAPRPDYPQLARVLAQHRAALRLIVVGHPDPRTRRAYRPMRGAFADLDRELRMAPSRRRDARINTLTDRIRGGFQTMTTSEKNFK